MTRTHQTPQTTRTLYIDAGMGAAGDMLTAALLELFDDPSAQLDRLNALGLPDIRFRAGVSTKCGIDGTKVTVTYKGHEETVHDVPHTHAHDHPHSHDHDHEHDHHHHHPHDHDHHDHHHDHAHATLAHIADIVATLDLPDKVRADIGAVYRLIGEAESKAHGVPVEEIHFHEVGTMDAIADITAVCLLMHTLAPDAVIVSPVHVGSGKVRCAHGILPVPAPATADILRGVPIYGGRIEGELCTPTGAALLKHFATAFGAMPVMTVERIGYGMGTKDFEAANTVRILLGTQARPPATLTQFACNLDDMTAEAIAYAGTRLFAAGAVDVTTQPLGMKKNRPGTLLTALVPADRASDVLAAMFRHTTTLGIRETSVTRHTLERTIETVETPLGPVSRKIASGPPKWEYDDLARLADAHDLTLAEVIERIGS